MPVSPALAEDLAAAISTLYADAELAILEKLRAALEQGIDSPLWAEIKLRSIGDLRAAVEEITTALQDDANGAVAQALATAYGRGRQAAVAEVGGLDIGRELQARRVLPNAPAVDRLAASYAQDTRPLYQRITRSVLDTYRSVVSRATASTLLGTLTRRQASQRALDQFAARGVTGFIDSAGRSWSMAAYAEMAVRSVTARAAIEGHIDALAEIDVGLVIVSDAPLECPLCLVPGTVVEGPVPTGRTRSEYTGDVVRIVTASGKDLTGTPEHPVLTPRGWVTLKDLAVGDKVISHDREKGFAGVVPDDVQVPTLIEEAGKARLPVLLAGPARRDLNKDIAYRKVRYVPADSELPDEFDPTLSEPVPQHLLVDRVGARRALLGLDDGELRGVGPDGTGIGQVHRTDPVSPLLRGGVLPTLEQPCGCESGSLFMGELGHVVDDGLMPGPGLNSGAAEIVADYPTADAEGGAELLRALTGKVTADEVVSLSVSEFSGHVWDLSTEPSWYVANGIVTHNCRPWEGEILTLDRQSGPQTIRAEHAVQPTNLFARTRTVAVHVAGSLVEARAAGLFHPNCRHSLAAYLPGVTTRPPSHATPGTSYEDTQRQREIERHIRAWKRKQATAMDESARRRAGAYVRKWQGAAREHVAAHEHLRRKPAREQIGSAR